MSDNEEENLQTKRKEIHSQCTSKYECKDGSKFKKIKQTVVIMTRQYSRTIHWGLIRDAGTGSIYEARMPMVKGGTEKQQNDTVLWRQFYLLLPEI